MSSSGEFLSHFPGQEIYATVPDKEDDNGKFYHYHSPFEDCKHHLKNDNAINRGVFFCVNELDRTLDPQRKRTKKMFVRARAVWVEDDEKRVTARTDWPIPPNLIVNSSPGKFHYYWLTSTDDVQEWDGVMNTMVNEHGSDNQAKDIARVLRLPGFNHCKKEPHEVTYVEGRKKPYDWEDILDAFPPSGKKTKDSVKTGEGVKQGMSIEQLLQEAGGGHQHGPSRALAMKLANYGLPKDEALAIMRAILPNEHHEGHHEQSLETAIRKVQEEKEQDEDELEELPKLRQGNRTEIEWPPGPFGRMCEQAFEMAHYPNRSVAIVTCVGMLAGICGRAFNFRGTGLNLYITLLMETGQGKDMIRKIIDYTLRSIDPIYSHRYLAPGRFTGPPAIWSALNDGMSKISVMTEAGILNGSGAGDREGVSRTLLALYTACGKKFVHAGERYSKAENTLPELFSPSLSLIQESTPKVFIETMLKNGGDINGDLGRMWLVKLNEERPDLNWEPREDFSEDILGRVKDLAKHCVDFLDNNSIQLDNVTDIELPEITKKAVKHLDEEYRDAVRSGETYRSVMASRAWVKSVKIAALISLFNNGPDNPTIDDEVYKWVWTNVVEMELNNVEVFIRGEDTSDLGNVVKNIVGVAIVKLLEKPSTGSLNPRLAKNHIFTRRSLDQVLKHNRALKEFMSRKDSGRIQDGLEKMMEYMVKGGLLKTVDPGLYGVARVKEGYKLTKEFYSLMKS